MIAWGSGSETSLATDDTRSLCMLTSRMAANAIAGGEWLGTWITVMSAVSNSGSFLSEMSVTSQTLVGMSERGFLPRKVMSESRHGTYPWALGVIAVIIAISQPLDFKELVLVCECRFSRDLFGSDLTFGELSFEALLDGRRSQERHRSSTWPGAVIVLCLFLSKS